MQGPNRYPNRYPTDTQLISRHAESNQLPCSLPGAAKIYFVYYMCTEKLRLPRWSCQNVLRTLHHTLTCTEKLRLSSRSCQSVLRILLKSCDFPAGAAKVYFVYTCTEKLRLSSWTCQNVLEAKPLFCTGCGARRPVGRKCLLFLMACAAFGRLAKLRVGNLIRFCHSLG